MLDGLLNMRTWCCFRPPPAYTTYGSICRGKCDANRCHALAPQKQYIVIRRPLIPRIKYSKPERAEIGRCKHGADGDGLQRCLAGKSLPPARLRGIGRRSESVRGIKKYIPPSGRGAAASSVGTGISTTATPPALGSLNDHHHTMAPRPRARHAVPRATTAKAWPRNRTATTTIRGVWLGCRRIVPKPF